MEILKLNATKREITGKQVKKIRQDKKLPAVVYGKGEKNHDITVDAAEFEKMLRQAGESTLIELSIDGGAPVKVLIQDVQREPLLDGLTHVDFRQVNMKEKLSVKVAFKFVGESPAIKEQGGILVRSMDEVEVRCLPSDLVHEIVIDLSKLKNLNDKICVKDLVPPPGIEFHVRPDDIIAVINEPLTEEELKALEEKPVEDVSAVKSETDEKKAAKEAEAATEGKDAKKDVKKESKKE